MAELRRSLLPNIITLGRIAVTPAVFFLPLVPTFGARLAAFVLFVTAAVSDLWDGYLARKHGWISDFGKLMDPLADKLLMGATLIPLYLISNPPEPGARWPLWGSLPLWVVLVIFLRELAVTLIRGVAARRGTIIPAGRAGKNKAFLQNFFVGTALLWHALHSAALANGWTGPTWEVWQAFHGAVLAITLAVALLLTLYSLAVYLRGWRLLARAIS